MARTVGAAEAGTTTRVRRPNQAAGPQRTAARNLPRFVVDHDLRPSEHVRIITGYASLEYLIDWIGEHVAADPSRAPETSDSRPPSSSSGPSNVYVAFGTEPTTSQRRTYALRGRPVSDEMRDYWLEHGINVVLCGKVVRVLKKMENGRLTAKISPAGARRLHAKVFVGDEAATVGSSNFSRGGMQSRPPPPPRSRAGAEATRLCAY